MSFYTGVTILTVLSMVLMSFVVIANYSLSNKKKRRFIISYAVIAVGAVLEWGAMLLETQGSSLTLHLIVKAMELIVGPTIPLVIMVSLAEDRKMFVPMMILVAVNAAMIIYSCFSGLVFYIDAANVYHHGKAYLAYNMAFILGILLLVITSIRLVNLYQSRSSKLLGFILVYLAVGLSMHMIKRSVWVNYLTISMVAIFMYVIYEDVIRSSDSLTKLLNRHSYDSLIDNIDSDAVIINIDVDYFKQCNDTYGHLFGDEVLKEIASLIRICMGRHGLCFRTGGDEFCVVIKSKNADAELLNEILHLKMADRRRKKTRLPFVSTGYAYFNPRKESIHDAIDRADAMMYQFKNLRKKLMAEGKNLPYTEMQNILISTPLKTVTKI